MKTFLRIARELEQLELFTFRYFELSLVSEIIIFKKRCMSIEEYTYYVDEFLFKLT